MCSRWPKLWIEPHDAATSGLRSRTAVVARAARCDEVVGVERKDVVRLGRPHAGHPRRSRAFVRLADDADPVGFQELGQGDRCVVGRAVVDDDDLAGTS
jgi:hypothetical protein